MILLGKFLIFGAPFDFGWTTFDLIGLFLFLQRGVRDVGADPKLLALMQVHPGVWRGVAQISGAAPDSVLAGDYAWSPRDVMIWQITGVDNKGGERTISIFVSFV